MVRIYGRHHCTALECVCKEKILSFFDCQVFCKKNRVEYYHIFLENYVVFILQTGLKSDHCLTNCDKDQNLSGSLPRVTVVGETMTTCSFPTGRAT